MPSTIDSKWFKKLKAIRGLIDLPYLSGDPDHAIAEKERFLKGEIDSVFFYYPALNDLNVVQAKDDVLYLIGEIEKEEKNELVRRAYVDKLKEKLLFVDLLSAMKERDDMAVADLSEKLYGSLSSEQLSSALFNLHENIANALEHDDSPARRENANIFFSVLDSFSVPIQRGLDFLSFPLLTKPEELTLSDKDIVFRFNQALSERSLHDWKSVSAAGKSGIVVDHRSKTIFVPETRKLSERRMKGLIAHEIDTHIMRRENAKKSPLRLLISGLAGYIQIEEGLATYNQRVVEKRGSNGGSRDVAFALARGRFTQASSFREVFEIMRHYFLALSPFSDSATAEEYANEKAFSHTIRTFRGTSGETLGAAYARDLLYHGGLLKIQHVLKEHPEEEKRFMVGKYNPADETHRWILDELGL